MAYLVVPQANNLSSPVHEIIEQRAKEKSWRSLEGEGRSS